MTIEVMTAISIVSVAIGIYGSIVGLRRNKSQDDKADASQITTVIVKLENIASELLEIKQEFRTEIKNIKNDGLKNHDDIIRIDESLKSAWKQINSINDKVFHKGEADAKN